MKIVAEGNYLRVLPKSEDFNVDMLLGWRRKKNDPWYVVEDNVVNRIVLGLDPLKGFEGSHPWFADDTKREHQQGLLDYQIEDVKKMCSIKHVLNANPMGLGKTPETIRYLAEAFNPSANVLVVTPKIIRTQWVDQLQRWWSRDSTMYEAGCRVKPGVWIINYDKLRNERVLMQFKSFPWDVLILDEAHKIKNRKSSQTLAVKQIPALHRIALTGTPILRYVDDLWSILHFLDWRYSGISYHTFVNYFCSQAETPWGYRVEGLTQNPAKVAILNKLLSLVSVRNDAVEVAHGKTSEVVRLPMTKAQRELYRKEKALLLDELPENCTISNGAVLTTRLRQTTSWPGLFLGAKECGPKFEWILETCKNAPQEQFVVFSTFEQTVAALSEYLRDNKVACATVTGKNNASVNAASRDLFMTSRAQVIAGTIGAMGQGYDGLQQRSRLMIFLDRDWSPEIMAQAEDRLHRMGQQHSVHIYYLECQGSFDQYVGRINRTKADDIREALASD